MGGCGRLNSPLAWCAGVNQKAEWWQLDLAFLQPVVAVRTQARCPGPKGDVAQWGKQRVTAYTVSVSSDGFRFSPVDGGTVFQANIDDDDTIVANTFSQPVMARYVRIVVESWVQHISMRAAVDVVSADVVSADAFAKAFGDDSAASSVQITDGRLAVPCTLRASSQADDDAAAAACVDGVRDAEECGAMEQRLCKTKEKAKAHQRHVGFADRSTARCADQFERFDNAESYAALEAVLQDDAAEPEAGSADSYSRMIVSDDESLGSSDDPDDYIGTSPATSSSA